MRGFSAGVVLIALVASTSVETQSTQAPSPQQPQQPVFRAGIELVTLDVTALDSNGRQVTDLTTADFQVEIDGDRRQVTSAEYVRSADPLRAIGTPHKVVVPDETFSSSNAKGQPSGRLIVILVDQGNIRTGSARAVMNSAKKFVDTLTPEDRVAVIAVPGPGELVDFTTNHDRVRESLLRIVGQAGALKTRFNLSVTESMAIYMRADTQLALEVILRECGQMIAAAEAERCEREVEQDAAELVNEVRHRTQDSVHGMRAVLKSLAALEGPKSVILVSEGLIFEGLGSETDDLASAAADSRATLDILLLDVPMFDVAQSSRPTTPREDRNLQVSGLEQLAGAARGELYRINVTADFAFDRISRSLDGYYLLAVESRPDDRNGRRHRLSVKSLRRGVTVRSRRTFLTTVSAKATSPEDAVNRAIRSPLPINDLPLKLSTWTYKEPGTSKVRVLIAAEVERLAGQSLDYTTGMALVNRQGRGVAPATALKTLIEKAGDPGTAVLTGMLSVDPGQYRLIVSLADSEGRVGSVSRAVTAWAMEPNARHAGRSAGGRYQRGDKSALVARHRAGNRGWTDGGADGSVCAACALQSFGEPGAPARSDARNPRQRRRQAAGHRADAHCRGSVAGDRDHERAVQHHGAAAGALSGAWHHSARQQGPRPPACARSASFPPTPPTATPPCRHRAARCRTKWRSCCSAGYRISIGRNYCRRPR